jgi:hypothetical protein
MEFFTDIEILRDINVQPQELVEHLKSARRLRNFSYTKPFDRQGYMYYIATENGTVQWNNPYDTGCVALTSSSTNPGHEYKNIKDVVSYDTAGCFYTTFEQEKSNKTWIKIDLKNNPPIQPTYYALKAPRSGGDYALRNWQLHGSTDDEHWTVLADHKNETVLRNDGRAHAWKIEHAHIPFRYFRLYATGQQQNTTYEMMGVGGFEIYGLVKI